MPEQSIESFFLDGGNVKASEISDAIVNSQILPPEIFSEVPYEIKNSLQSEQFGKRIVSILNQGFDYNSPNIPTGVTGSDATVNTAKGYEVNFATSFLNNILGFNTFTDQVGKGYKPVDLVLGTLGSFWSEYISRTAGETLGGLSKLAGLTIGDITSYTSVAQFNSAVRAMKKRVSGKKIRVVLNQNTIDGLFLLQENAKIETNFIKIEDRDNIIEVGSNGVVKSNQFSQGRGDYVIAGQIYAYELSTVPDGLICLIEDGGIQYGMGGNFPLEFDKDLLKNQGMGLAFYKTRANIIVQTKGTSVKKTGGISSYAGYSPEQLLAGGIFENPSSVRNEVRAGFVLTNITL